MEQARAEHRIFDRQSFPWSFPFAGQSSLLVDIQRAEMKQRSTKEEWSLALVNELLILGVSSLATSARILACSGARRSSHVVVAKHQTAHSPRGRFRCFPERPLSVPPAYVRCVMIDCGARRAAQNRTGHTALQHQACDFQRR